MKQYIVEFNNELDDKQKLEVLKDARAEHIGNVFANFELVECSDEVVGGLKQHEEVISVEVNGQAEKNDTESPDFPMQFINTVNNAHTKGYKGDGVIVAVIDSGLNYEHEDLQFPIYKCARILNSAVKSVDVLADIKDLNGHGTATASVIAMQDNNKGYIGVAPNAKIMIIKATNTDDGGSMGYSDMAKSIIWAVDNGAHVINISYGQSVVNSSVKAACQYAYERNVSVIASAGNAGDDLVQEGNLTATENVGFWKDYVGVLVIGSVRRKNNFQGKQLLELPLAYNQYKYSLIYYNRQVERYRLILSDYPLTIETSTNPDYEFQTHAKGYNEAYDYYPKTSQRWDLFRTRTQNNYVINWDTVETLGPTYPNFVYTNHDVIDNKNGGVIHTGIKNMDEYKKHLVDNFNAQFKEYSDTPQNIIKAPFSSFGQGIDFVAPGYFNLAGKDASDAYRYGNGTSYSSPYVAGMIAILRQRYPDLSVDDLYKILKDNALTVGDGNVNYYGNGLATMPDLSKQLVTKLYYRGQKIKLADFLTI